MKTTKLLLPLLTALSASTFAASPDWTFVEAGYASMDIDGADEKANGFTIGGFFSSPEQSIYGRADYTRTNMDLWGLDVRTNMLSFGGGYKTSITDTTDVYVGASFERMTITASLYGNSGETEGSGFGAHAGVRSMVTDQVELYAEAAYVKIKDMDIADMTYQAGARYSFTEQFGVGASFEKFDDADILRITASYAF